MSEVEKKIVFAIAPPDERGVQTLLVGVPGGAWKYIKPGKTNHFDLSSIGVPLQLVMFGGKDHDTVKRTIDQAIAATGHAALDRRRDDFSIKPRGGADTSDSGTGENDG